MKDELESPPTPEELAAAEGLARALESGAGSREEAKASETCFDRRS